MKYLKKFESATTEILKISDLKKDDTILYQGSRYIVDSVTEFLINATSVSSGKSIKINQGQLDQFGIRRT